METTTMEEPDSFMEEARAVVRELRALREDAFLSADRGPIEKYLRRIGVRVPGSEFVFWTLVHKVRTAVATFPRELREQSKTWLHQQGVLAMDEDRLRCGVQLKAEAQKDASYCPVCFARLGELVRRV